MGARLGPGDMKMDSEALRAVRKDELQRECKEERDERLKREAIREERNRDRERERRLEAKHGPTGRKSSKITRDRNRDISEKVALGMANTGTAGGKIMYDQRLFTKSKDWNLDLLQMVHYTIYTTKFTSQNAITGGLYRPRKDADSEMYGGEHLNKVLKTDRFRADKGFAGAGEGERESRDGRPVNFKDVEEADPFGLDQFLTESTKGNNGNRGRPVN